jgi:hypothetical protein
MVGVQGGETVFTSKGPSSKGRKGLEFQYLLHGMYQLIQLPSNRPYLVTVLPPPKALQAGDQTSIYGLSKNITGSILKTRSNGRNKLGSIFVSTVEM